MTSRTIFAIQLLCLQFVHAGFSEERPYIGFNPNQVVAPLAKSDFLDDQTLITLSTDKAVRIIDIESQQVVDAFRFEGGIGVRGQLTTLDVSTDKTHFAVGTYGEPGIWDPRIYVVSLKERKIKYVLREHERAITSIQFRSDGKQLASASKDGQVIFWDLDTGKKLRSKIFGKGQRDQEYMRRVAYSEDGQLLVCAGNKGAVYAFDTKTFSSRWAVRPHRKRISAIVWVNDYVVSCSPDGKIMVLDARNGGKTSSSSRSFGEGNNFQSLARQPGTNRVIWSNGIRDTLNEWLNPNGSFKRDGSTTELGWLDVATGKNGILDRSKEHTSLSFSTSGRFASYSSRTGIATVFDFTDLKTIAKIRSKIKPKFQPRLLGNSKTSIAWGEKYSHRSDQISQTESFDLVNFRRSRRRPSVIKSERYDQIGQRRLAPQDNTAANWVVFDYGMNRPVSQGTLDRKRMGERMLQGAMLAQNKAYISTDRGQFVFDPANFNAAIELTGQLGGSAINVQRNLRDGTFLTNTPVSFSLWSINTKGDPLVSYVLTDEDYVAWTPDGFYSSSPGGERLVGWHVNNGDDEFASFHPLETFCEDFYNEGLIRSIPASTLTQKTAPPKQSVAVKLPAVIKILSPSKSVVKSKKDEIDVKVRAESKGRGKVSSVSLLINNKLMPEYVWRPGTGEKEHTFKVRLSHGDQTIQAKVESFDTRTWDVSNEKVKVQYSKLGVQQTPSRKLFFLGIGIDNYDHYEDLQYCVSDVNKIGNAVKRGSPSLFENRNPHIQFLENVQTFDEFTTALDKIDDEFTTTDLLVVYWSGHGDVDPQSKDFYFVLPQCRQPSDDNAKTLRRCGVKAELVAEELAGLKGRVVLVLDTCYSGKAISRMGEAVETFGRESGRTGNGLMMISSAGATQKSKENNDLKMATFAFQVHKALKGEQTPGVAMPSYTCVSGKGCIVFSHTMKEYLIETVKHVTRSSQIPFSSGFDINSVQLTKVRGSR